MDVGLLTVESARTAIVEKQFTATRVVEEFYKKIKAEDGQNPLSKANAEACS